jgi:predicted RNA-binding Zn-ribbon protein involved in translation (DUF1610 family)
VTLPTADDKLQAMDLAESPRGWLLLAAGDDRQHGGSAGYDDDPSRHYSWDSTVPNHGRLAEGDPIALWDKHALLGASVIERILEQPATKPVFRCANCGAARIKERRTLTPRYKCFQCGGTFDKAIVTLLDVVSYRSVHEAGWVDLHAVLSGPQLRAICVHPKSQHSMRPLRWTDFRQLVDAAPTAPSLAVLERATQLAAGHLNRIVRVRRGQRAFRQTLLGHYGDVCAFTGPAPRDALEAAHLYSYAAAGVITRTAACSYVATSIGYSISGSSRSTRTISLSMSRRSSLPTRCTQHSTAGRFTRSSMVVNSPG